MTDWAECPDVFTVIEDGRLESTHECEFDAGHAGLHKCPWCGTYWRGEYEQQWDDRQRA